MDLVLDASVSMRWLQPTNKQSDQHYAESILTALNETMAIVPDIWQIEISNAILTAEKYDEITTTKSDEFTSRLKTLNIFNDGLTSKQAFTQTIQLARQYKLSSYDASYLEIAIREDLPIATLDKDLRKAAFKANVSIYLTEAK